mmetsp:Transcript_39873/g.93772  ORF Transcript_39873/g.93772 Transcript_39873/m.93772 type:complete len:237 (-) Transcript_39873:298-1008(-)
MSTAESKTESSLFFASALGSLPARASAACLASSSSFTSLRWRFWAACFTAAWSTPLLISFLESRMVLEGVLACAACACSSSSSSSSSSDDDAASSSFAGAAAGAALPRSMVYAPAGSARCPISIVPGTENENSPPVPDAGGGGAAACGWSRLRSWITPSRRVISLCWPVISFCICSIARSKGSIPCQILSTSLWSGSCSNSASSCGSSPTDSSGCITRLVRPPMEKRSCRCLSASA